MTTSMGVKTLILSGLVAVIAAGSVSAYNSSLGSCDLNPTPSCMKKFGKITSLQLQGKITEKQAKFLKDQL